jgi:hypothetical protein
LERLLKWLQSHFNLAPLTAAGGATIVIATVICVALLILLIYWFVASIWRNAAQVRFNRTAAQLDALKDTPELYRAAQLHADKGEYRVALRYLFRGLVLSLKLLDSEHLTNWQLMRLVRREYPAGGSAFTQLVAIFEESWYGGAEANGSVYGKAQQLVVEVEQALAVQEAAA